MGARFNLHSQAKPRLHRAIPRWGGMAQLFCGSSLGRIGIGVVATLSRGAEISPHGVIEARDPVSRAVAAA
jgi:hypothetical protein